MKGLDSMSQISRQAPPERIHKLLARHGLASRRTIEQWVECGQVQINGRIARLGDRASLYDHILVNNQQIKLQQEIRPCALIYHKPCGEIVSHKDEKNRRTIFASLPKPLQGRWVSVGRLDYNTSGLLILCNDGELARRMMHPAWKFAREYRVRVQGHVTAETIQRLLAGVPLGKASAKFSAITACGAEKNNRVNNWFRVVLHEGKNREVRRLWESQGLAVSRLQRIRFGDVRLDIESKQWRWMRRAELKALYARVGIPFPETSMPRDTTGP